MRSNLPEIEEVEPTTAATMNNGMGIGDESVPLGRGGAVAGELGPSMGGDLALEGDRDQNARVFFPKYIFPE